MAALQFITSCRCVVAGIALFGCRVEAVKSAQLPTTAPNSAVTRSAKIDDEEWEERFRRAVVPASRKIFSGIDDLQGSYICRLTKRTPRKGAEPLVQTSETRINYSLRADMFGALSEQSAINSKTKFVGITAFNRHYFFRLMQGQDPATYSLSDFRSFNVLPDEFSDVIYQLPDLRYLAVAQDVRSWKLMDLLSGKGGEVKTVQAEGEGDGLRLHVMVETISKAGPNGSEQHLPGEIIVNPQRDYAIESFEQKSIQGGHNKVTVEYRDDVAAFPFPKHVSDVMYDANNLERQRRDMDFEKPVPCEVKQEQFYLPAYGLEVPGRQSSEETPASRPSQIIRQEESSGFAYSKQFIIAALAFLVGAVILGFLYLRRRRHQ
jgi:hypothetical protein